MLANIRSRLYLRERKTDHRADRVSTMIIL